MNEIAIAGFFKHPESIHYCKYNPNPLNAAFGIFSFSTTSKLCFGRSETKNPNPFFNGLGLCLM
ncbi:MAG: hypothetical protein AAF688_01205 [Bacteroidota bacterium]